MSSTPNLHALLDQAGWIHALARKLVNDPHLADDLVQETWVDALEQRPDASRPVRGWLATVARNKLSKLRRGERNRTARERGASREERQPSTLDVVERAATHRDIVLAVLALDEPYRSTLLMRFFEQLSYDEIARRTGVQRASVNSRVTRGLEQLRQRLETTYGGDRRALALALLPLAKLPTSVAPTLFGIPVMNALIGTSALTLLTVAVSVGLAREKRASAAPELLPAAVVLETADTTDQLETPPFAASESRTETEPAPVAAVAPVQEQRRREPPAKETDEKVWKTELFHAQPLPASVEALAVNTSSGDVEIVESSSGQLEIKSKVRAKLDVVKPEELTQVFEDHAEITEENGVLKIEDAHHDARGWDVSFVVSVPGKLPLTANSGSGDVIIRTGKGRIGANTGSGDVKLILGGERVTALVANTGSGDVVIEVAAVERKLMANTGSGDVTALVSDPSSPGDASFNSGSGDVMLLVPANTLGNFELETNGDEIVVPPALGLRVEKDVAGRLSARGSLGGGGNYKLSSGSGSLTLEIGTRLPTKDR
jgi:RNA polymerase sigma-70 factor (ECF subfamily)